MKSRLARLSPPFWSKSAASVLFVALALAAGCDDDDDVRPQVGDGGPKDSPVATDTPVTGDAGVDVAKDATDGGGMDLASDAAPVTADNDFAVVRFNANGTLDTNFGSSGIARISAGVGSGTARDSLWGVAKDGMDRLLLFGAKKADTRTDNDRVVARLTANGALDTSFATMGFHTLNIANLSDGARNGIWQADGKIVASGYTSQPTGAGTQTANKVVLLRLDSLGVPDPSFGVAGVVNSLPLPPDAMGLYGFSEAYAAGRQSTGGYVTTGYGRLAASGPTTVDMLSFRFDSVGKPDTGWGTGGVASFDLVTQNDRGRNLVVLPDDRVFIVGSASPSATTIDAMAMMLTPDGARDTTFAAATPGAVAAPGVKTYDFTFADEAFYGTAVSPSGNWLAAAGYRSGTGQDDDAILLLVPLAGAVGGAEVAKAVPLSETEFDRFWAVTFDANNKVLAAGFIRQGGDNWMAVARFNTDGTLDATFGTAGVAKINVAVSGTDETARGLVVQSDGKIVIAGNVEVVN